MKQFALVLVHLMLLSAISISRSYAAPVPAQLRVLRTPKKGETTKMKGGCSDARIAKLEEALGFARELANSAAEELSKDGAELSEGVQTWLGPVNRGTLRVQVAKRFTSVARNLGAPLKQVLREPTKGETALLFHCQEQGCSDSLAMTQNKGSTSKFNQIQLCPLFFKGGLDQDIAAYTAKKNAGKRNKFRSPTNARELVILLLSSMLVILVFQQQSYTLLHEAQHSLALLGSSKARDNLQDFTHAAGNTPQACHELQGVSKALNAENWALVAFLIKADPARFA
ncbi:hypothetical protein Hypma_002432 [Hypsizygus marmoreus]|uniref:Uncharacterized protein n=1 Tax=Hypsizygus marmoreus TaxID=39966 RepID=A0A369J5Q3_HYPMA|nr:hypothetical protein Hypma_002432 [Hypsizygus marmoreus]